MELVIDGLLTIDDYIRRRGCEGKKQYQSRDYARRRCRVIRRLTGDRDLHAYRCTHCPYFHVGHRSYAVLERMGREI